MKKKIILGVIGVIVVLGIIGAASGDKSQKTGENTSAKSDNKQQEAKQIAKVGETVQDGDLAFTVTKVDTASSLGNSYTKKNAQGLFYVITLKVENKGKETKTVDSSMITLTDNQGRKFDRSIEGQTAKGLAQGNVDLFLQQVQPSLSVTGDIIFDIPKDAAGLKLLVKGSLFGGKTQEIDLGK